jgi:hypothetical protein
VVNVVEQLHARLRWRTRFPRSCPRARRPARRSGPCSL